MIAERKSGILFYLFIYLRERERPMEIEKGSIISFNKGREKRKEKKISR